MKSRPKKRITGKETVNVTKQVLARAAKPAIVKASRRAMEVAGYIVKAENGWVVRVDQDGTVSKISKISKTTRPKQIVLD